MRKAYESTIEEAVEAQFRVCECIGSLRRFKRGGLLIGPMCGAAVFLLFTYVPPIYGADSARLIVSGTSTVLFVALWLLTYRKEFRRLIRKTVLKMWGTDQPVPSECEIDESGLAFRRCGQEVRFSWASVQSLTYTANAIELIMLSAGVAIIPKRIFDDPSEWQRWIMFIEEHVRSEAHSHCRKCGYILRGLSEPRCPECGEAI